MVSKAEYLIAMNKEDRQLALTSSKIYTFANLNEKGEFQKDADDGSFDSSSFVMVSKNGTSYSYCICVIGSKRKIGDNCNPSSGTGCILSTTLSGIDIVSNK